MSETLPGASGPLVQQPRTLGELCDLVVAAEATSRSGVGAESIWPNQRLNSDLDGFLAFCKRRYGKELSSDILGRLIAEYAALAEVSNEIARATTIRVAMNALSSELNIAGAAHASEASSKVVAMPPEPISPAVFLESLLAEAETRRRQDHEISRLAQARGSLLSEHALQRERLAEALDRVYFFPGEEKRQGRKPCPEGFRRWSALLLEVGVVVRECDEAIVNLRLKERLHAVACWSAPAAMKYACALLLLACEGDGDALFTALQRANGDSELREFVLWLPVLV
jgi:hypothetical protein